MKNAWRRRKPPWKISEGERHEQDGVYLDNKTKTAVYDPLHYWSVKGGTIEKKFSVNVIMLKKEE